MFGGDASAAQTAHRSRLTVVGPRRRIDMSAPAGVAVVELIPQLVRMAGEGGDDAPQEWVLTRLDGSRLQAERTLSEEGVLDGEMLYLRSLAEPLEPVLVEDFVEAIATVVEASGGWWARAHLRRLLIGLGGAVLAAGAATLLPVDGQDAVARGALGLGAGLGLLAAAAILGRVLHRRLAAMAVALAALPFWALAGAHLATLAGDPTPGTAAVAAGAGLVAGAAAAWLAVPDLAGPAMAVGLAAGPLAGAAAWVVLLGATPVQAAAALAVLEVIVISVLPNAVTRLAGLTAFEETASPAVGRAQAGVREARWLLSWLLVAAGIDTAAALGVLAFSPDLAAPLLCAAVALAVALRARRHHFVSEVLPLSLTAAAGGVLLAASLLAGAGSTPRLVVSLGVGALLVTAGLLAPEAGSSAQSRRRLNHLESLANVLLVPLALWAGGVFAAVADWAGRI